ncbi:MAG TPA: glycosyltransferase [Gaiellaceae bacterium]|nr:glycosyltransferase [Gaiellaceae bacterium]
MRRVVFVTQVADPAHPVLGATSAKIRELAARVDELVVLAARVDRASLPANCRAHEFAAPSQALRGARYVAALAPEVARRPSAVVAHMAPVFALLAAPLTRPLRVPLLLWFTGHASAGRLLDAAEHAVDAIFSVDERSLPRSSRKLRAIGHGIDVAAIPCVGERTPPLRRLLGLGRYAPVKEWPTLLRAAAELDGASVTIHGPGDPGELRRLAAELGVDATLGGDVPYGRVPELLAEADAVVNATRGASADKVVFEAAAACLPVFAASPVFDTLLPESLRFPVGDHAALAARIRDYAGGAGPTLRARVEAEHSAAHWAERILEAAR